MTERDNVLINLWMLNSGNKVIAKEILDTGYNLLNYFSEAPLY